MNLVNPPACKVETFRRPTCKQMHIHVLYRFCNAPAEALGLRKRNENMYCAAGLQKTVCGDYMCGRIFCDRLGLDYWLKFLLQAGGISRAKEQFAT